MDNKQEITFTISAKMSREDAEILASFLHEMVHDLMKIEAVVSFVVEDTDRLAPYIAASDEDIHR